MDWNELYREARAARENAYAPFSGFAVGAALRTAGGTIWRGANVENRSYGATLCAERVAVAAAVAAGERELAAIAIVTDAEPPAPPCGLCLQVLAEFARPELPVLLGNVAGERVERRLDDLLPHPFELPGG